MLHKYYVANEIFFCSTPARFRCNKTHHAEIPTADKNLLAFSSLSSGTLNKKVSDRYFFDGKISVAEHFAKGSKGDFPLASGHGGTPCQLLACIGICN